MEQIPLEIAIATAVSYHGGQVDKAGKPYILHLLYVMRSMETEEEMCVAVLHDILEDTKMTLPQLQKGFSKKIVDAVKLLTHMRKESYQEYIDRIVRSANQIVIKVKIADLKHNCQLFRLAKRTEKDITRTQKYAKAIAQLAKERSD